MNAEISGKELVNEIEVPEVVENFLEKLKRKYLENLEVNHAKCITLGFLKVVDFMTVVFRNHIWVSDIHRWHTCLVLSAEVFYIVCKAGREVREYLKSVAIRGEHAAALNENLDGFGGLMESIEIYMGALEDLNKTLGLTDDREEKFIKYLVKEFDYTVHQILIVVELLHKKLQILAGTIKRINAELNGINLGCFPKSVLTMMANACCINEAKLKTTKVKTRQLMAKVPGTWNVTCNGYIIKLECFIERLQNDSYLIRGFPEGFTNHTQQ